MRPVFFELYGKGVICYLLKYFFNFTAVITLLIEMVKQFFCKIFPTSLQTTQSEKHLCQMYMKKYPYVQLFLD